MFPPLTATRSSAQTLLPPESKPLRPQKKHILSDSAESLVFCGEPQSAIGLLKNNLPLDFTQPGQWSALLSRWAATARFVVSSFFALAPGPLFHIFTRPCLK